MLFRLPLVVVAVLLLAALPPRPEDTAVYDSLDGTWDCVYMENDSGVPMAEAKTYWVVIRNQRMSWMQLVNGSPRQADQFDCHRDPLARPMAIDMTHLRLDDAVLVKTLRGIYVLEGDTLTISWGRVRPATIAKQRNGQPVYVLQRRR